MGSVVWIVFVSWLAAASAHAEQAVFKVGSGYEIVVAKRTIDVRKGKRRAVLFKDSTLEADATVDPKTRRVTITRAQDCGGQLADVMTLDQLEARLVNTEALVLHRKKAWANAARRFAQAAKLDPAWNLPAFNLASAHARLGAFTEANAALAPWFRSAPLATYIQVSLDRELQPLLATKEVLAVRGTTKPGTARVTATGIEGEFAYSADRGWLALMHSDAGYLDCEPGTSITIFDVKTTKQIGSIYLGAIPSTEDPCDAPSKTRLARARASYAAHAKSAEQVLVAFGFAKVTAEQTGAMEKEDDSDKQVARFSAAKVGVVESGGKINVLRGNVSLGTGWISHGRFTAAAWLPDAHAVVVTSYVPSDMCARTDEDVVYIANPDRPTLTPGKRPIPPKSPTAAPR